MITLHVVSITVLVVWKLRCRLRRDDADEPEHRVRAQRACAVRAWWWAGGGRVVQRLVGRYSCGVLVRSRSTDEVEREMRK